MKTKTALFLFFSAFLFAYVLQLTGCQTPKSKAPIIQESWQAISNRWSSDSSEKIRQSAEHGNISAQFYLGQSYFFGNQIIQDQDEALKWIQNAASNGLASAQNGLGRMYEIGKGVPQDYTEAAQFYRLAADQGYAMAQNNLGRLYFYFHEGVPQNSEEGIKWFQKSAEQGEPLGEENLARAYAKSGYTNFEVAEEWMKKAVDLNSAEGQYKYANFLCSQFDKDGHQVTTNFPIAAEWFRKAAEQGYAKAQYQLADMYHSGELGDDQRSNCIPWFLKAAAQGNAEAQAVVGELPKYYPNSELLKSVNTIETLRQGAENGDLDAQFQLARRYQFGVGVPIDPTEAFKWMQKAAQHSQDEGSRANEVRYYLAVMYEKGEGTSQDLQKAYQLYQEAAYGSAKGPFSSPAAMLRVGQMYERGEGVPQDDQAATAYYFGTFSHNDRPDKFPNGYIMYGGPIDIESLYRLWSQGRGLPLLDEKNLAGYREPSDLIKSWETSVNTAKTEMYLGEIYYQGKFVPQDFVEADTRFHVAANQNLDDARKMLVELEPKMSSEQKKAVKIRYEILEKEFEQATDNAKRLDEANQQIKHYMPW